MVSREYQVISSSSCTQAVTVQLEGTALNFKSSGQDSTQGDISTVDGLSITGMVCHSPLYKPLLHLSIRSRDVSTTV